MISLHQHDGEAHPEADEGCLCHMHRSYGPTGAISSYIHGAHYMPRVKTLPDTYLLDMTCTRMEWICFVRPLRHEVHGHGEIGLQIIGKTSFSVHI